MDKYDLFLNFILLNDLNTVKNYIKDPLFNLTFENNYAFRFCLEEKKIEAAQLLLNDKRVADIINKDWIEHCIKEQSHKEQIHLLINAINF